MQGEVGHERTRRHWWAGSPRVQPIWIAIEIFTVEELFGHGAAAHELADEIRPSALRVVEAAAVGVGRAEQPIAVVERVLDRVTGRFAVFVNKLAAEFEVVGRNRHRILRSVRRRYPTKASGVHGAPSGIWGAVGAEVTEDTGTAILTHQLVHHHVEIHIEASGMSVGDELAYRVYRAVPGWHAALLILTAKVAAIEHAIAVAPLAGSALRLRDRRQLDCRETDIAQSSGLVREKVEQPRRVGCRRGGRHGNASIVRAKEPSPGDERDAHQALAMASCIANRRPRPPNARPRPAIAALPIASAGASATG